MTSLELLARWLHSGDTAVVDRVAIATRTGGTWVELTYGELDRQSAAVAGELADMGVATGDRVALLGESGGDWAAGLFGILRRGAVAVTLDAKLTAGELEPLCRRSGLSGALVSSAFVNRWTDPAPLLDLQTPTVARMGDGADSDRGADHPAVIVWTSGTTGEPKGVTLSFANLAYVVGRSSEIQGSGPEARWLSVLPPNHLLELCCGLLPALAAASSTFVARTVVPSELATMMREAQVDRTVSVPLVVRLLKRHLESEARRAGADHGPLGQLRSIYCGGAPLDPEVVAFFDRHGIGVLQGYGLTEASPTVSMNSPGHNRIGSVGRPLPGTEVRISDEGEILVRGPGIMLGYLDDNRATAEVIDTDGWLHTGDLGLVDDDGYLFVTGRAKSLIVLDSGKKVQPEEVETALARSERFAEVGVVGWRVADGHRETGEKVCAVVVPSVPMAQEEAEEEVRRLTSELSGFKRPTVVHLHEGELPKTVKRSLRRAGLVQLLQAEEARR